MYIKGANQFPVIEFATVSLYLTLIIKKATQPSCGKMAPPQVRTAARYCRYKNRIIETVFFCGGKYATSNIRKYF